ncbi:hypothetical protein CRG98_000556 [Punica granatum]|uniref:Uncharacterized protein n=1 Tax=Punica granatum TaxID=22663 RepID=A0A2I0LEH0_PUNGR|nr:hypothetical protein CRG98_000556 [Punica granatum]
MTYGLSKQGPSKGGRPATKPDMRPDPTRPNPQRKPDLWPRKVWAGFGLSTTFWLPPAKIHHLHGSSKGREPTTRAEASRPKLSLFGYLNSRPTSLMDPSGVVTIIL